jgi:hypothetical protein
MLAIWHLIEAVKVFPPKTKTLITPTSPEKRKKRIKKKSSKSNYVVTDPNHDEAANWKDVQRMKVEDAREEQRHLKGKAKR